MVGAFLLGRYLQRRHYLNNEELSAVSRQHIDLFQGGQLSEERDDVGSVRGHSAILGRRRLWAAALKVHPASSPI